MREISFTYKTTKRSPSVERLVRNLCAPFFFFFLWQTVCVARRIEFSELEPVMVQKEILVLLQCIKIGLDYR